MAHSRPALLDSTLLYHYGRPDKQALVNYADGSVNTPPPPTPAPGNPFIDPETGERYPGAPGG